MKRDWPMVVVTLLMTWGCIVFVCLTAYGVAQAPAPFNYFMLALMIPAIALTAPWVVAAVTEWHGRPK